MTRRTPTRPMLLAALLSWGCGSPGNAPGDTEALGGSGGSSGAPMGGAPMGGAATGGTATGGTATGGTATGGTATGGTATGGTATGGSSGECQPSCGSHKWACWRMPNPAGTDLPNPANYSTSDGVVHDNVTCLDWQASPPDESYTWQAALDYCESLSLGGHDDWRLPTRVEMTSIVDFTRSPAADVTFPDARSGFHKTASDWILTIRQIGAGAGRDFAWAFNLGDGIVSNAYSKATAARLRCVRGGGTGEGPSEPAVAPPNQYTFVSEAEALDNYTGLIWQRQGDASGLLSWEQAVEYCRTLNLNGHSWRLPSVRELATLVDEAQVAPAINRTAFPAIQYGARSNDWYWASHRARNSTTAAWALNFDDGFTGFNAGASGSWNYFTAGHAKCVR